MPLGEPICCLVDWLVTHVFTLLTCPYPWSKLVEYTFTLTKTLFVAANNNPMRGFHSIPDEWWAKGQSSDCTPQLSLSISPSDYFVATPWLIKNKHIQVCQTSRNKKASCTGKNKKQIITYAALLVVKSNSMRGFVRQSIRMFIRPSVCDAFFPNHKFK